MMYDELIAQLREKGNWLGFTEQLRNLFNNAADAIEELQGKYFMMKKTAEWLAEKVPTWITVTERLPSVGDKVIVAIRDESGDTRYDYTNTGWYSGNGYKWVVEDEYCSWVTHWMPLPEPPKEE